VGIFLLLLYTSLLSLLILKWRFFRVGGINRFLILSVLFLKLFAGLALTAIYSRHYEDRGTGDTFRFYDDALVMHRCLQEQGAAPYLKLLTGIGFRGDERAMPYYMEMTHMEQPYPTGYVNDNATMIRLNALFLHLSRGEYFVHVLFWCFMALMGLTALLKILVGYFPRKRVAMFFSVYLLPTVLFWGSGVLKEPITLLGMGLFLLGLFRYIFDEWRAKHLVFMLLGVTFMMLAKGYVLYLMAPAVLGLLLAKAFDGRHFWLWFSLPHFVGALVILLSPALGDPLNLIGHLAWKQQAFYNEAMLSGAGSVIEIPRFEQATDLFTNAPRALINAYLRPWIWESTDNLLYLPAALENLLLMGCLFVMLWNFRKPYGLGVPFIAFALSFVLMTGVIIGGIVPVMGAVVRYKMPALIFLFALSFILTDHILLQRRFPFIRRMVKKLWRKPY